MNKLSNQSKDDVISIDSIIDALYDVISGAKGEERNWDGERHLFHSEARLWIYLAPRNQRNLESERIIRLNTERSHSIVR